MRQDEASQQLQQGQQLAAVGFARALCQAQLCDEEDGSPATLTPPDVIALGVRPKGSAEGRTLLAVVWVAWSSGWLAGVVFVGGGCLVRSFVSGDEVLAG